MHTGKVPTALKTVVVSPLLKKSSLDHQNLKNYRPVSNLPYLGKLLEKVAISQLDSHFLLNDLHEPLQSAYRANHSVETALMKVSSDILSAIDKKKCVLLVLLDLSAAFDTVDHSIFLNRMNQECGVDSIA